MIEEYYNSFYQKLAEIDEKGNNFNKVKKILPKLKGNEKILDIGCGYGSVSEELIKKGFEVTGIEINDKAIEKLKQKGFKVLKRDINKALNINYKYDVVMILDVLEHVFDPLFLLNEAKKVVNSGGFLIITVPLYFDFLDRIKIFFTGNIISLDNLCYGKDIYKQFKTYNYDHIRFFRPKDVLEMEEILGLELDKLEYVPTSYQGKNFLIKLLVRLISNKYTVKLRPELFAHHMRIRWRIK